MTPHTDPRLADLERQIAETRDALGQTVEELAAKVDVPSRAKAKARETADRLRGTEDRARARAAHAADTARSRVRSSLPGSGEAGNPADSGAHRAVTTEPRTPPYVPVAVTALAAAGVAAVVRSRVHADT